MKKNAFSSPVIYWLLWRLKRKKPLRQFHRFHRHFSPYSTSRFPAKTNREANEVTGAVMSAVLTI